MVAHGFRVTISRDPLLQKALHDQKFGMYTNDREFYTGLVHSCLAVLTI